MNSKYASEDTASGLVFLIQPLINKEHFDRDNFTKEDAEELFRLLQKYVELGGDIQYFIQGSGAPGNCSIS